MTTALSSSCLVRHLWKTSIAYSRPLSKARILWIKVKGHGHPHRMLVFFPDGMPVSSAPSSHIASPARKIAGSNAKPGSSTGIQGTSRERINHYRSTLLPSLKATRAKDGDGDRIQSTIDGNQYREKTVRQRTSSSKKEEHVTYRHITLVQLFGTHKFNVSKRNRSMLFIFHFHDLVKHR
jgi:hypothetical protein